MGIRSTATIKIVKKGTAKATPLQTISFGGASGVFGFENNIIIPNPGDYQGNLLAHDISLIPGITPKYADEYFQDLKKDILNKTNETEIKAGFFKLFANKKQSRDDNDAQLQSPECQILLQRGMAEGWLTQQQRRVRCSYQLTEKGKSLAALYSATTRYVPFSSDYLPTKYIHAVPEYQRSFFNFNGQKIFAGFRRFYSGSYGSTPVADLEFLDLTPPASRVKNPRFDAPLEKVSEYQKEVKAVLKKFQSKPLSEINPLLYNKQWNHGNITFHGVDQNGNERLFQSEDLPYAYFKKYYGDDVKLYMAAEAITLPEAKQNHYDNYIPMSVVKDNKIVGVMTVRALSTVPGIIDTRDIKKPHQYLNIKPETFINFWRRFGKM